MSRTVVALFDSFEEAREAVREVAALGIPREQVSLVAQDSHGKYGSTPETKNPEEMAEDAGTGAGTGAAIGGIAGLVIGLAALALPGVGPIVAAGPLAAALTGAGIGAAAGGLLGALAGMGVPDAEAALYAEGVQRGGTLVTVRASASLADQTAEIMNRHGAVDVEERANTLRDSSSVLADPVSAGSSLREKAHETGGASPRVTSQGEDASAASLRRSRVYASDPMASTGTVGTSLTSSLDEFDADFRNHHTSTYGERGDYEKFAPVYRQGVTIAQDPRYRDRSFESAEPELRQHYEQNRPDTAWEDIKDAVRYSWNKVSGKH